MNKRLVLLHAMEEDMTEGEVLRLALFHAVCELDGWGGAVHLCGPMGVLRLVLTAGLPPEFAPRWDIIAQDSSAVPARAVREDGAVWAAAGEDGGLKAAAGDDYVWPAAEVIRSGGGLAAVPLAGEQQTSGALTVVTSGSARPPQEHWNFLHQVAAWAQERLALAPPPDGAAPEERDMRQLQQAMAAGRAGTWDWNIRTGALAWDDAAMAVYGTAPEEFVPHAESWMKVVHPDDLPWTLAAVEKAIRDRGAFEAEYRVRRPSGGYAWTHARGQVLLDDDGLPYRMIGTSWETHASHTARDALSRALLHMSDGFLAVDEEWRISFVNLEAERILGSSEQETYGRLLWSVQALRQATGFEARCREAAAAAAPTSFDMRLPDTGCCYQLRLVPVPGGLTLYFTDVTDRRRLEAERQDAERAAARRSAHIAELTTALSTATTSHDVVDAVAQGVLPPFDASGLLVQAVEGDRVHNVGSIGYPDAFLRSVDGRTKQSQDPVWDAIVAAEPVFVSSPPEYSARYPGMADHPARTGKQSWAFLPLTASGRSFGICVVSFDQPRRLSDEDRTLLTAISALVAHALERARLFDAEHTRSQKLQRALLPRRLPQLSACTAAARYLPAAQGMDVGGDWYDVIPLSSGRVALVVGDVMGHGLSEAAMMGRLRTAVHTLAALELPPDEIMSHLNDAVGDLGEDFYATCLYVLYDSTSGTCSITSAGQPPPAFVYPDGTVSFPALDPNPPLGAAEPPFLTVTTTVPPESLIVLYTDGLVESAECEIDQGMDDLARVLHGSSGQDLERLCDEIVGVLVTGRTSGDDIALLVARVHALPSDHLASWPLPEDPRAASQARAHVREQLEAWGLDELSSTTELLVSELVGNVVRHGKGPMRLRLLRDADLVCEVSDCSLTMPRIRTASETDEGGRGLQLVAVLSQRWGTRYTAGGKWIWAAQSFAETAETPRHLSDKDALPPPA
ncbi:SpoIIE family protein phosphatase [Streptomyces sp. NPDC056002]|uniref:SpoIIE family protein phosphatase n=1 Tax=Streptomyces sp. NPDC056002 TaxID=3345675 RepID=UPI0035D724B6